MVSTWLNPLLRKAQSLSARLWILSTLMDEACSTFCRPSRFQIRVQSSDSSSSVQQLSFTKEALDNFPEKHWEQYTSNICKCWTRNRQECPYQQAGFFNVPNAKSQPSMFQKLHHLKYCLLLVEGTTLPIPAVPVCEKNELTAIRTFPSARFPRCPAAEKHCSRSPYIMYLRFASSSN